MAERDVAWEQQVREKAQTPTRGKASVGHTPTGEVVLILLGQQYRFTADEAERLAAAITRRVETVRDLLAANEDDDDDDLDDEEDDEEEEED